MDQLKNILGPALMAGKKNQRDGLLSSDNYFFLKSKMSLSFKNMAHYQRSQYFQILQQGYVKTKCHSPLEHQAFSFYGLYLNLYKSIILKEPCNLSSINQC